MRPLHIRLARELPNRATQPQPLESLVFPVLTALLPRQAVIVEHLVFLLLRLCPRVVVMESLIFPSLHLLSLSSVRLQRRKEI